MALPSIAGRAIHVKFNPRPHNLSESTDILKILERYGQVDYFRQLQVRYMFCFLSTSMNVGLEELT